MVTSNLFIPVMGLMVFQKATIEVIFLIVFSTDSPQGHHTNATLCEAAICH
jgi:hypothetical protein